MTICLEHDPFDAVLADVRRAAADLAETRERAVREVAALLDGGWTGAAASSFAQGWSDWADGAADVGSALDDIAEAMVLARSRILVADDTGADSMARLADQLAGRLG